MVRAFFTVAAKLRQPWLFELVGAGLVVAGLYVLSGLGAALVGGGVAGLAKSAELEMRSAR